MADDKNNTGNKNSGYENSGNWNSGNGNSSDWNSGNRNSGHGNSGNKNTGNWNSGDWNSGDWNSGYFNSDTPSTVRVFNKECSRDDWENAVKPFWLFEPSPTTWVSEGDMTNDEKEKNPTFSTCCGYLRKNDWEEEWRKAFEGASEEDVQKVRDLPNFDYDVFEEITGLDIRPKEHPKTCDGKTVVIDGVKYELREIK